MIRTYQNRRVESAGKHVQLFRYPNLDVTVSRWGRRRSRTNVAVYHHGKLADDPLWIDVLDSAGRRLKCNSHDVDAFLANDPGAQIIPSCPVPDGSVIVQVANDIIEHEKEKPITPGLEILFKNSDGGLCWIDWRDIEKIQGRYPDGYTVPGPCWGAALNEKLDPGSDKTFLDSFLLTPEDYIFLWSLRVGC
jgi:hypothetical protein